jgi:hypothetical protein
MDGRQPPAVAHGCSPHHIDTAAPRRLPALVSLFIVLEPAGHALHARRRISGRLSLLPSAELSHRLSGSGQTALARRRRGVRRGRRVLLRAAKALARFRDSCSEIRTISEKGGL